MQLHWLQRFRVRLPGPDQMIHLPVVVEILDCSGVENIHAVCPLVWPGLASGNCSDRVPGSLEFPGSNVVLICEPGSASGNCSETPAGGAERPGRSFCKLDWPACGAGAVASENAGDVRSPSGGGGFLAFRQQRFLRFSVPSKRTLAS